MSKSNNCQILLLGEPGYGKTVVLARLFYELKKEFEDETSDLIPIYLPLSNMQLNKNSDAIYSALAKDGTIPFSENEFYTEKSKFVLLLDGLDELKENFAEQTVRNKILDFTSFNFPCVISCRSFCYERNFSTCLKKGMQTFKQIKLKPLEYADVSTYIDRFCKCAQCEEMAEYVKGIIKNSDELIELSKSILMLLMIVDILLNPENKGITISNQAELYRIQTETWLEREAEKNGLKREQKRELLREVAWFTYERGLITTFDKKELKEHLENKISKLNYDLSNFQKEQTFILLVDDLFYRTLLKSERGRTNGDGMYKFVHKSFQEYFVADRIFAKLTSPFDEKNDTKLAHSVKDIRESLKYIIPAEIAVFLKDMLKRCEKPNIKSSISKNLRLAYDSAFSEGDTCENLLIRQHSCHYLSRLKNEDDTEFLESVYKKESNEYVKRGIIIGLILFGKREDLLENYVNLLNGNLEESEVARNINIGYHLVYYGDRPLKKGECDFSLTTSEKYDGTIRAIIHHLKDKKREIGWPIDLITLRNLLEQEKEENEVEKKTEEIVYSTIDGNEEYKTFLKDFLDSESPVQVNMLSDEKGKLNNILKEHPSWNK
ncbi:NACHT domain-containing protein [Methanosarcina sp. Mfa9]|uniref:NACHT domain-containing protein n=1 Tax=Methanosarcina sp. Mfa9 TaxID=3439063 RepID=UPI003F864C4B